MYSAVTVYFLLRITVLLNSIPMKFGVISYKTLSSSSPSNILTVTGLSVPETLIMSSDSSGSSIVQSEQFVNQPES